MSRVLVLANEPPWPAHNGGRTRVAGLVTALAAEHEVLVAATGTSVAADEPPVRVVRLPPARRSRAAALVRTTPRLGAGLLDEGVVGPLRALVLEHRADALLVTHTYLLPLLPGLGLPVALDLPNLEVARTASGSRQGTPLRRAVAAVEHVKARRWEPAAVRTADLCLAVDEGDAVTAQRWGACRVVVVPNASDATPLPPSPADGYVLAVADWRYAANRDALPHLLDVAWPAVRCRLPHAELVLVGRGAPDALPAGVSARGFVEDLASCYAGASVTLAPATSGGGTQVKVADALAHGRVVVCPPYGRASLPGHVAEACVVTDDLAAGIAGLLRDVEDRHRRERLLAVGTLTWAAAAAPLSRWMAEAVSRA